MRFRIRPNKSTSKKMFFIGVPFCIFGVIMVIYFIVSGGLIGVLFGVFWLSIAIFKTYTAYKHGFTDEASLYDRDDLFIRGPKSMKLEMKLRKIEKLYNEELIDYEEYCLKRREAIMSIWYNYH